MVIANAAGIESIANAMSDATIAARHRNSGVAHSLWSSRTNHELPR